MMNEANGFFTDETPDQNRIWTAAFLNERFQGPVSPLGWTLIREGMERLALREPLCYLGVAWPTTRPLTRLYRGHPYSDAEAFWSMYKLFPDTLLPDDAVRYFPSGETGLRRHVAQPAGRWDPRVWWALARSAGQDLRNWSPWHNWREWRRFEGEYSSALAQLDARVTALESDPSRVRVAAIHALLEQVQVLNRGLLRIHRWSLTHADVTFTLLRRSLGSVAGPEEAAEWSARLAGGLHNLSLQVDNELAQLAALRRNHAREFEGAWRDFLGRHGHRSYSLDIVQPPFAADPAGVLALLDGMPERGERDQADVDTGEDAWRAIDTRWQGIVGHATRVYLRHLSELARQYMSLRENQRYQWQRGLALIRRLVLMRGRQLASDGALSAPEDVFFLTWEELRASPLDPAQLPDRSEADARRRAFEALCVEYTADPASHYPLFLRGNRPLAAMGAPVKDDDHYWGRAASPGRAVGPVTRVTDAAELGRVHSGAVLVARSTDPGWTPVFGRIAALVTETGGLLSHGAVVAREYRLPAVVAVPDIFERVSDGEVVEVDGSAGRVTVLPGPAKRGALKND